MIERHCDHRHIDPGVGSAVAQTEQDSDRLFERLMPDLVVCTVNWSDSIRAWSHAYLSDHAQ